MNSQDEQFFKELGARVAQARKDHGLTQQQLAEQLGLAQQTYAHYEVGRARIPASMLPTLAKLLTLVISLPPIARSRRIELTCHPASRWGL